MHAKLRAGDIKLSSERALDKLRCIQHQKIIVIKTQPIACMSTTTQEHNAIQQLTSLTVELWRARHQPLA
jgi:hypothetical protein